MWAFAHMESPPAEVRATQGSVGERVTLRWMTFRDAQFDDEEGKQRTKEEIGDLQEITGPHPCCMIAQERFPGLPTGSLWANLLHILLNGPFTHSNIQLKEFSTDALRSPESVICCHLLDQCDGLAREPRVA